MLMLPAVAKDWEKEIASMETKAEKAQYAKGGSLFVGSSSIRMWDLKKSFPKLTTINHGFGGSELSDSIQYAERIVMPFEPKVVFLYAGDNDMANGKSVEVVTADFQTFAAKIHKALPETQVVFLPIKPSLKRWAIWPEMKKANLAIKALTEKEKHLHYLDTVTPMLGEDGKPMADLFKSDGLHMTEKGYALWNKVVADWVASRKES
ncbi:SGNH/GDSL hydrolase family protein [Verrucomicrobiaceae bacterium 227]